MRHDTNTLTEILVARVSREGEILVSNPKNVSPKIIFVHDLYYESYSYATGTFIEGTARTLRLLSVERVPPWRLVVVRSYLRHTSKSLHRAGRR